MKVRDIMTRQVVTAGRGTTARELARMMADQGVGSVIIAEGGEPKGIVTDRDLVVYCLAEGRNPDDCTADEIMSTGGLLGGLAKVDADDDTLEAAKQMGSHKVRRLPVVDQGNVVGVVSAADLASELRTYVDALLVEEAKAAR